MDWTMSFRLVILGLLMVLLGSTSRATPVMWERDADLTGWSSGGNATVSRSESGGNLDGFLKIEFTASPPTLGMSDIVANSEPSYKGDYSSRVVTFDYFGTNSASQGLYFQSSDGSTWGHAFSSSTTSWEHFEISFFNQAGWEYISGDTTDYAVARTNVALFGFSIVTPSVSDDPSIYTFGIDNLEFNLETQVPEPSTVMMLLSVILCLLVTFRVDRFILRSNWIKRLKQR